MTTLGPLSCQTPDCDRRPQFTLNGRPICPACMDRALDRADRADECQCEGCYGMPGSRERHRAAL